MTTPSHTIAPRRTYLIGRARPNAIVGKNRETGEIALIIAGAFLGMMSGLIVPILSLRIVLLTGFPSSPWRSCTSRTSTAPSTNGSRSTAATSAPCAAVRPTAPPPWRRASAPTGVRSRSDRPRHRPDQLARRPFGPDEIAVLLHADRRTVTAAIEIEGPGVGLRDSEDQEALVDRFGTLLKHVANGDGFVTRIQMLARTLPADPDAHAKDVAQRGDKASPGWLQDSYDQLQSMVSTSSEQHRAYLVACMHYTRELAAEANAMARAARPQAGRRLDRDAGLAVVMARELTDICARLAEADIRVRQPLGQSRLASLVHSMYDPDHPIDHIQAMTKRNAWPAELDAVEPTFLQAKTRESVTRAPWCHSTAWVKEWPMTPVGVNFLAPLLVHTPDVIRTVAVCMDLEPTEVAIERMLTEKTNDEAEASRQAKMNRTVDPRDIAAHGRLDQRGEDLASGAAGVNLVGYITVSSRSPEALARDKRTIRASAGKSYLKLEWCDREHHRAFVNTLPFATGIRR